MNQNLPNEDIQNAITILKIKLFMADVETYNEAIEEIKTNIDDTYFLTIIENLNPATEKMNTIVSNLLEEMETLRSVSRIRLLAS